MQKPNARDLEIRKIIIDCGYNATKAAIILGISAGALYFNLHSDRQQEWWRKAKEKKKADNKKARYRRAYEKKKQRALELERYRLD